MSSYVNRLYQILYPDQGLVASQLTPEEFARHYLIGSVRHYSGKLVFAEIDPSFRHPYFNIEEILTHMVPHEDGSPKRTKFICSYRVMEHMDFNAIQKLYLTTSEAHVLELVPGKYDKAHQPGFLRTYAEIAPLSMLVMSPMNFPDFGRFITEPGNGKGCPKLFYTQIDLDQPKAYAYAKEVMSMNSLAADAQEGIKSFFEKRKIDGVIRKVQVCPAS